MYTNKLSVILISFFVVILLSCSKKETKNYYDFYVGSYTKKEGHVDGKGEGIYQIRIRLSDTTMSKMNTIVGLINPSFVKLSPDKKTLYAVSEITPEDDMGRGRMSAFQVAGNDAIKISDIELNGFAPCHIGIDPSGKICSVTNYIGEKATVFPILPDGKLYEVCQNLSMGGFSVNPTRQEAAHLHSTIFTHNNKYAYILDLGSDRIHIYTVDTNLSNFRPARKRAFYPIQTKGAGPRHGVVSKDDKYLYVLNELDNTVTTYSIDPTNGDLETITSISTLPDGFAGQSGAADIHFSLDEKYLFASNRGSDDIVSFKVLQDGKLEKIGNYSVKGKTPRNFVITSDGKYLIAANQDSDNLTLFEISKDGKLTFIKGFMLSTPVCIEEI